MSAQAVTQPLAACTCRFGAVGAHHDKLVRAATDVTMALELVELALTWQELDYSGEAVVHPRDWLTFADEHRWQDPDSAYRLFSAAREVALRRLPATAFDMTLITTEMTP